MVPKVTHAAIIEPKYLYLAEKTAMHGSGTKLTT